MSSPSLFDTIPISDIENLGLNIHKVKVKVKVNFLTSFMVLVSSHAKSTQKRDINPGNGNFNIKGINTHLTQELLNRDKRRVLS